MPVMELVMVICVLLKSRGSCYTDHLTRPVTAAGYEPKRMRLQILATAGQLVRTARRRPAPSQAKLVAHTLQDGVSTLDELT